jgi:hypothetical protein
MNDNRLPADPVRWFSETMRLNGAAHSGPEPSGDPRLIGKRLGLINGAAWVTPWAYYFGRLYLPGVHLLNVANEAVQVNFMEAHNRGEPTPPHSNIEAFVRYARDLVELGRVDAVMITCSTMNRAYTHVQEALQPYGVPVVQIDRPMMDRAVQIGGKTLVVATHGPTVESTQALLREAAAAAGKPLSFDGLNVEEAWRCLSAGDVEGHNQTLAQAIHRSLAHNAAASVVLAQLSMTVLLLSYPDPQAEFGAPVLTSGQCGFEHVCSLLLGG